MKKSLLAGVAALFLATGTAQAEDTLVTTQGGNWKCQDGIVMRYDTVGERYEAGASTTLIITGLPRRGPSYNNLHITCGKRGCPVLNGKRCMPE
jgi:hypothetical protein